MADTKITDPNDPTATRHVYENALPKLVILRPDLCIGIAGRDPEGALQRAVECRDSAAGQAIRHLREECEGREFLVATVGGGTPRLWRVRAAGAIPATESGGRAWIGAQNAFEQFQERYSDFRLRAGDDPTLALVSAMNFVAELTPEVPSVGGYTTRCALTREGFRFVADAHWIGPEVAHMRTTRSAGRVRLDIQGRSGDHLSLLCLAGAAPTIGAIAYFLPEMRLGYLYPYLAPWDPIRISAESVHDFVIASHMEHGQTLTPPPPAPFHGR